MHQRIRIGSRSVAKQRARTKPTVMVAEQHGRDTPWRGSWEHNSERIEQSTVEQIPDTLGPEMVEQLMKLPKTVSQDEIQTVQPMEVPLLKSINKVVDAPVVVQRKVHVNQNVQKTIEDIQLQYTDDVVDVLVVVVVQIPQVQVVAETVEIPRLRIVEKIDETPEFDAGIGKNPFAKVEGLITRLIDRSQTEVSHVSHCDEETSMAAEKKEDLEDDTAKHSSTLETAVPSSTDSVNGGHPDKICDQFSDVVLDACLTCDTKCKVASETCVKDNMFMVTGEITVAGKLHHETVMKFGASAGEEKKENLETHGETHSCRVEAAVSTSSVSDSGCGVPGGLWYFLRTASEHGHEALR